VKSSELFIGCLAPYHCVVMMELRVDVSVISAEQRLGVSLVAGQSGELDVLRCLRELNLRDESDNLSTWN